MDNWFVAWKPHVKTDFVDNGIDPINNGAGEGGTVFLSWKAMMEYLGDQADTYWVAPICIEDKSLRHTSFHQATIETDCTAFLPFNSIESFTKMGISMDKITMRDT